MFFVAYLLFDLLLFNQLHYYYHRLLRRSVQGSVHYSAIVSQFTQTLSETKWKGRTLQGSVLYSAGLIPLIPSPVIAIRQLAEKQEK
jgi:hypothetical protein